MDPSFLPALRSLLGDQHVVDPGAQSSYETDWRGRFHGHALAVARPGTTRDVAAVVRLCAAHGVPIVTQGGNTGLVGGGVPDASGRELVLSLGRMQRVRSIDADNLSATVEAGCVLHALRAAAAEHGLLFPLSLGSEGSCTLGGNLATNAGGTQVLRYGNARDLCLGLEVVTASGDIWEGLSGLRKDNTGYDLRDLFIGSEGTLGVITAATMKLFHRPGATLTAVAACTEPARAVDLLRMARSRLDAGLTGFELMGGQAMRLVARHFPMLAQSLPAAPCTVLLELAAEDAQTAQDRLQDTLAAALAQGLITDAVLASSLAQAEAMWQAREAIPLAQAREGLNIKHDISLPISEIAGFLRRMDDTLPLVVPGVRQVVFGHVGDGNLHFNLRAPEAMSPEAFLREHEARLNAHVYDAVAARGGSFSAEHGIGVLRLAEMQARKSPVALAMMRSIKRALDPQGLLNPGRLLPPDL